VTSVSIFISGLWNPIYRPTNTRWDNEGGHKTIVQQECFPPVEVLFHIGSTESNTATTDASTIFYRTNSTRGKRGFTVLYIKELCR
jgi:hypothetical protein